MIQKGVSYLQDQPGTMPHAGEKPPYISCLLACVALLYVTHLSLFPLLDLPGLFVLTVFCALYALLLATNDVRFTPVPPVVCAISLLARAFFADGFTLNTVQSFTNLIFALLTGLALYVCLRQGSTKSVAFAVLCAAYTLFLASHVVFLLIQLYGAFNLEVLEKGVNDLAAYVGKFYSAILENTSSQGTLTARSAQSAETIQAMKDFEPTLVVSVRLSLPSFAVCFSMIAAALTLLFYKPTAHALHAEKKLAFAGNERFSLSSGSVVMFYVSYGIYLITSFTASDSALFVAFMNLSAILTYPFAWIGIRFLYTFLCKKLKSRAGSIALLAVAFPLFGMLLGLGGLIFTFLAFVGASSQLSANLRNKLSGGDI